MGTTSDDDTSTSHHDVASGDDASFADDRSASTGSGTSGAGAGPAGAGTAAAGTAGPTDPSSGSSRSRLVLVLGLVVAAVMAVGVVRIVALTGDRDDLRTRIEELDESLRIARGDAGAQIEQLESENSERAEQVEELLSILDVTSSDLETVRAETTDLAARLDERRAERDEAVARVEELEAELAEIGPRFELMPVLVGAELLVAEEFADELGLDLLVEEVAPGNVIARPGAIIEQLPIDETVILPGTVIWVQVYTPDEDDPEE